MSKPTHIAYVVTDPKEGSDKKPIWREVGAVWKHKNGNGFDLVLVDQISVSACRGTRRVPEQVNPHLMVWYPCQACGGSKIEHCCEGLREQPEPVCGNPKQDALRHSSNK